MSIGDLLTSLETRIKTAVEDEIKKVEAELRALIDRVEGKTPTENDQPASEPVEPASDAVEIATEPAE